MGFDFFISMVFNVCPSMGRPYYINSKWEKEYDLSTLEVPEEYRKFFQLRGHFLHAYTEDWNDKDIFNVHLEDFLEEFPSWETVKEWLEQHGYDQDEWPEADHKAFKACLEWCVEQSVNFYVYWSY